MKKLLIGAAAMAASTQASAAVIYTYSFSTTDLSGFSSEYQYIAPTPNGNTAAAQYTVANNAFPWNGNFASYFDHTVGDATGAFMVVNGAAAADTVWQNVPALALNAGSYRFSFWLSHACCNTGFNAGPGPGIDPAPARLWMSTDGGANYVNQDAFVLTGNTAGVWQEVGVNFSLASAGNITFAIINDRLDGNGNDFGLDDITLAAVPEPATWALMVLGFGLVGAAARRRKPVAAIA